MDLKIPDHILKLYDKKLLVTLIIAIEDDNKEYIGVVVKTDSINNTSLFESIRANGYAFNKLEGCTYLDSQIYWIDYNDCIKGTINPVIKEYIFDKKKICNKALMEFKRSYADLIMIEKYTKEEFSAMKYYETLLTDLRYRKKGVTLVDKQKAFFKRYPNFTLKDIECIMSSRAAYMGVAQRFLDRKLKKLRNIGHL